MELYSWQKECLEEWKKNDTRGIVNVITGAGKTVLALAAAAFLKEQYQNTLQIRIVVPTIALARQWKKALTGFFPETVFDAHSAGFYYGQIKSNPDRPVMIYVVNSARTALAGHILADMKRGHHVLLICDECHRYTGEMNRNIFRFIHSPSFNEDLYHCIGLSATPKNRYYETILVPALGREIYRYDLEKAGHDHLISPFALMHTAISLTGEESEKYGEITDRMAKTYKLLLKQYPHLEYADTETFYQFIFSEAKEDEEGICALFAGLVRERRDLIFRAENRIPCVLALLKTVRPDEKVILFAERIEQAEEVYGQLLPLYGNRVVHYHSEMPAALRRHNLSMFRIGEARILISCKALDEGLDVPDASVGIVMSCTSVTRQRIQRLGRILRRNSSKNIAVLYYIYARGTSEEENFLPDEMANENHLIYDGAGNRFDSFQYSIYASELYRRKEEKLNQKQKKELLKCLEEGIVYPDWFLDEDVIDTILAGVSDRHEKNYWIAMKQMSQLRKDTADHLYKPVNSCPSDF